MSFAEAAVLFTRMASWLSPCEPLSLLHHHPAYIAAVTAPKQEALL